MIFSYVLSYILQNNINLQILIFFTFLNSFIQMFHVVSGNIEYLPSICEGLDMFLNSTYDHDSVYPQSKHLEWKTNRSVQGQP